MAYCRCLQHWVEKRDLPINAKACPLVRNVRELIQAVDKFMHVTARDILKGLDMDQPMKAVQLPFTTLFGQVLSLPVGKPERMPIPEETRQHDGVLRSRGRAHPFSWLGPTQFSICLPRAPTVLTFPSARAAT